MQGQGERGGGRSGLAVATGDADSEAAGLEGADVGGGTLGPADAALIGCGGPGGAAGVDRRTAGQQCDRLGRSAVVSQRGQARVGNPDQVAVVAIDQPAGAAGADQVVVAGRRVHRAGDVVGRCASAGAVGVERDNRVVQDGRAAVVDAAAVGRVVGECGVDDRQRAGVVDAAAVVGRVGGECRVSPTSALVARIPQKNQALRVFSVTIQIISINKPRCTN